LQYPPLRLSSLAFGKKPAEESFPPSSNEAAKYFP
jgi:hypothetical protein